MLDPVPIDGSQEAPARRRFEWAHNEENKKKWTFYIQAAGASGRRA
jgi:hypothetical protein